MEALFTKKSHGVLILIFFTLILNFTMPVSAENGIDIIPNLENTPLEEVEFTTPSEDLSNWELTTSINENAENISHLKLETQICVYDPILCHAPKIIEMNSEDNISWSASITTLEKHSYVNWRIHIVYENESELLVPERSEGYAKVWSTCWEIMEDQIIINGGEECNALDSSKENISGFSIVGALLSLVFATAIIRKNQ